MKTTMELLNETQSTPLVIAYCDKEEKTKRVFTFSFFIRFVMIIFKRIGRMSDWIIQLMLDIFTEKKIVQEASYTRIYTLDENGLRKLDKMPKSVMLLLTQKEKPNKI